MSEYGWTTSYICNCLTREQIILFQRQIADRKLKDYEIQAKLHDKKFKRPVDGLDTEGATAIEDILAGGGKTL